MSSKLQDGWVKFLRNSSRQDRAGSVRCPLCNGDVAPELVTFKEHVRADSSSHGVLKNDTDIEEAFRKITLKTTYVQPRIHSHPPAPRFPPSPPLFGSAPRVPCESHTMRMRLTLLDPGGHPRMAATAPRHGPRASARCRDP